MSYIGGNPKKPRKMILPVTYYTTTTIAMKGTHYTRMFDSEYHLHQSGGPPGPVIQHYNVWALIQKPRQGGAPSGLRSESVDVAPSQVHDFLRSAGLCLGRMCSIDAPWNDRATYSELCNYRAYSIKLWFQTMMPKTRGTRPTPPYLGYINDASAIHAQVSDQHLLPRIFHQLYIAEH